MKLLNPLFDTVFKFLLEDIDVAKTLIEAIIRKEIVEIAPAPQESSDYSLKIKYFNIGMIRQDFVAIIKTVNDSGSEVFEKVMIEVQKSPVRRKSAGFDIILPTNIAKKALLTVMKNISR